MPYWINMSYHEFHDMNIEMSTSQFEYVEEKAEINRFSLSCSSFRNFHTYQGSRSILRMFEVSRPQLLAKTD